MVALEHNNTCTAITRSQLTWYVLQYKYISQCYFIWLKQLSGLHALLQCNILAFHVDNIIASVGLQKDKEFGAWCQQESATRLVYIMHNVINFLVC